MKDRWTLDGGASGWGGWGGLLLEHQDLRERGTINVTVTTATLQPMRASGSTQVLTFSTKSWFTADEGVTEHWLPGYLVTRDNQPAVAVTSNQPT